MGPLYSSQRAMAVAPQMLKRAMDIVGSAMLLVLFSPLMLVLSLLVWREGGQVFFSHPRVGRHGVSFPCLKFRTMVKDSAAALARHLAEDAEAKAEWDAEQKLKNDPRVTKLGRFMRRTSLDELPQLVNVLRGDMSMIGPRPIMRDEVERYRHYIADYYRVRPGITGLWQVSGRNNVSYAKRVKLDRAYVRRWSLWLDIVILFRTVPALLSSRGAY